MPVLHLGVIELSYADFDPATGKKRKGRKKKDRNGSLTTGDVAEILESKYHVMEIFFQEHEEEILGYISDAMVGALETALMGGPSNADPYAAANDKIKVAFQTFIESGEMERLGYPGVPTQAALDGVSHRFKHPYAKRPARPSFVDTGLYVNSFKAWLDDGSRSAG